MADGHQFEDRRRLSGDSRRRQARGAARPSPQILALAPGAQETISYGIPSFRFDGPLVAFGAAKKHCALYGMSSTLFEALGDELAAYDTSKGTIRFQPDAPLPESLVRRVVLSRLAENRAVVEARAARKAAKKRA